MARNRFEKPKDVRRTVSRLLGYLTRKKWPLLLVLLAIVTAVGTNIGGTTFVHLVIINHIADGTYAAQGGLLRDVIFLVVVYLVGAAAVYAQSAIMVQLAQRGTKQMRKDLFDHLQTLPLQYFDRHTHGELMSRFTNDADYVQAALEQSVVSLLSSILMFIGVVAVMIAVSPLLFLVSVFTLGVTGLVFKVFGGRSRQYYREQQAALGRVNGSIQETIEGLKVVKAFTHEEASRKEFQALNEEYRRAATSANFYSSSIMPIAMNTMNIGYALTAAFGGVLSILMGLPLGSFTLYLGYCRQVGQPLAQISQQLTSILSALAGAERIFDAMDAESEVDEGDVTLVGVDRTDDGSLTLHTGSDRPHSWAWRVPKNGAVTLTRTPQGWAWAAPEPDGSTGLHPLHGAVRAEESEDFWLAELTGSVRLRNVDFSYVPGKPILRDVSVYANPGQKIAFVGSTGAGKTTITNLINRFYEIDSGSITMDGIPVTDIRKDDLRRSLGAVLQDTHLFTGTILDNIRYGRLDATDEECIQAARTASAHSFIRRLPEGYQTMVTGDGANLSQGQRQLLAIARAAVADPPVMVLDEATSSIDTRTEALIQQGMDALMEGRTVFVIAHRLSTVRNADCIVVVEGGRIVEKGSHEELLARGGRYYQLYTGRTALD